MEHFTKNNDSLILKCFGIKIAKALGLGLGLTFTGFGAIIGLPCLAIKGGEAIIEKGTVINAQVMGYYNINTIK